MKKSIIAALTFLGLIATGVAIWFATKPAVADFEGKPDRRSDRVIQVHTIPVKAEAIPFTVEAVGTVEADQSVAIRAEVSGELQKIFFREGDLVKAGQLLFQIDAAAQQAEVEKARANLSRDQAAWDEARAQAHRLESLVAKEYVTQQEYAQAVAQEQAAHASMRANQAALKTMQLQLGHARITAPISGRAGILNVKPGNLVSAASPTPLVVINATQPVMVAFSVPQQQLQEIREGQRKPPLMIEVRRDAKDALLASGELAFIDNAIDTQTGTIRMKARIPNKDEVIWPGELVSLRLVLGVQQNALVVPESAVQPGQDGSFVYVPVDGKAHVQAIKITRQSSGRVIVSEGLAQGQQVVVNPPKNLRPDSQIELIDTAASASAVGAAEPRERGKGRKGGKRNADSGTATGDNRP